MGCEREESLFYLLLKSILFIRGCLYTSNMLETIQWLVWCLVLSANEIKIWTIWRFWGEWRRGFLLHLLHLLHCNCSCQYICFNILCQFLNFCGFFSSSISLLKQHSYFYSHAVGIDEKSRETVIYVKSHKKFVLQPQEPLQNLVSANTVVWPMFCLDSALDGAVPGSARWSVCKVPADREQNWYPKSNLGLMLRALCSCLS